MAAASKRGADNDDDLFSYSNTIELTFAKKPRTLASRQKQDPNLNDSSSSSDSDEPCYDWKQHEIVSDDDDVSCSEKDELIVVNDDLYSKESPSPGPPKLDKNAGAVSRDTAASMKALNNLKRVLSEEAPSPVVAKSNLDDLILIDDSPASREMTIKIKCHGIVKRYKIAQNEPFAHLINSIAKKEGTTGDKVMLYLGDKSIKQDDTPFTVHCNVADIFECVIVNEIHDDDGDDEKDGKVNIKIQTKESHSKEDYHICKLSPLEEIVRKYCQQKNISFDGVKIFFDGEELSLHDTPEGLDMENGDVIDLKYR